MRAAGLSVVTTPMELQARVLQVPTVRFGGKNAEIVCRSFPIGPESL